MFVFANFIQAVAGLLDYVLTIYIWVIIIRALITWVNPDPNSPIVMILYRLTEPVLRPVQRRMPDIGGLDLSPIVVILVIIFLQRFLITSLYGFAHALR